MLTNLLAVFVVILLSCPSVAEARDNSEPSQASGRADDKLRGASRAGRIDKEKPGQAETVKLEKTASDEDVEPTVGGDRCPSPSSQEDGTRVLTARLKGSLCVSCLFHLEKKIQELAGVKSARVIRPPKSVGTEAGEKAYAQVQIIYLPSKTNPKKIRKFVQRNDFGMRDENDVAVTDDFKPLPDPFENERSSGVINAQFK